MKTRRGFMDNYRHYDPQEEGYGSTAQWRGAFRKRMSREEADTILNGQKRTPYEILGVKASAVWAEVRAAYRTLALKFHPDRASLNGLTVDAATRAFQELQAAYSILHDKLA